MKLEDNSSSMKVLTRSDEHLMLSLNDFCKRCYWVSRTFSLITFVTHSHWILTLKNERDNNAAGTKNTHITHNGLVIKKVL